MMQITHTRTEMQSKDISTIGELVLNAAEPLRVEHLLWVDEEGDLRRKYLNWSLNRIWEVRRMEEMVLELEGTALI